MKNLLLVTIGSSVRHLVAPPVSYSLVLLLAAVASCRPAETEAVGGPDPGEPTVEYVTEQEILTPLPLRVRLPARYGAERVIVFVQTWGSRRWDTLELARAGQTWTGEVSCRQVSTVTGDTRYYFLAVDRESRPVIGSGSPAWPHVATVVHELPGGARALAGVAPPDRCYDLADCPPDFVGCPAHPWQRPACREDSDCHGGSRCNWDGYCSNMNANADEEDDDVALAAAIKSALHKKGGLASTSYAHTQ